MSKRSKLDVRAEQMFHLFFHGNPVDLWENSSEKLRQRWIDLEEDARRGYNSMAVDFLPVAKRRQLPTWKKLSPQERCHWVALTMDAYKRFEADKELGNLNEGVRCWRDLPTKRQRPYRQQAIDFYKA